MSSRKTPPRGFDWRYPLFSLRYRREWGEWPIKRCNGRTWRGRWVRCGLPAGHWLRQQCSPESCAYDRWYCPNGCLEEVTTDA